MLRLYSLLLYLALPLVFLRLLWRGRRNPAYRARWGERLGRCPATGGAGTLWIHAVSVGEAQAAEPLVRQLQATYPERRILITTTTPTGANHVAKLFGDRVEHCYFPLDLPFAINRFLDRVRPALLLMMETEIWPNLLQACAQRGIPSLLANARLSQRSADRYARFAGFSRQVFAQIGQVAAQSDADGARFQRLGVPGERIQVTGSLKFDLTLPASLFEQAEVLRRSLGLQRPVWVAASTREGEEPLILEAQRALQRQLPGVLLVLVPRHPERFDGVDALCRREGFQVQRRSQAERCASATQVYLGDSMGELPLLLAAADAAFVGGSLVNLGGHNVLEAAVLGKPVAFGPFMYNFAEISRLLLQEGAARQVGGAEELGAVMLRWLDDAEERHRVGERGRQVVERNRGAGARLFALVQRVLSGTAATAP